MTRQVTSTIHSDLEGRITFMSDGAEEIFGYDPQEMLGKERVSIFSPGMVVVEHVPRWLKSSVSDGHFETDTVFIRKDGSRFPAHIRITPIIKDGVHEGYIGVTTPLADCTAEDVTPRISLLMRALSWLYVTRAPFLTATIVPVLVGALVAPWLVAGTDISVGRLLLTLLGASLAHLGANTANDYFDWRSGVDDMNTEYVVPYSGGSRMIQLGVISARGMLSTSLVLYAVAAGAGAYLATSIGIWPEVAGLAVAGAALGFLYTAPPLRLAARGLGELAILMAFGPLLVAGATLIQTGSLEPRALLVGLPTGILTGAIIWVNQFPDVPADSAGGKNTLVVRMGQMTSRWLYILLWALAYASVVGLVVSELLPVQALVGLLSMPLAIYVTVQLFRHFRSRAIRTAQAGTIYLHLVTGLLLALGVWLAI